MFTRQLYELIIITNDQPSEPLIQCKYVMRMGPTTGRQCEKTALPGSEFCQSCTKKREDEAHPRALSHPDVPKCAYIFTRGPWKGRQCSMTVETGITLCCQHKAYRSAQQYIQRAPIQSPPPPEKKEFVPPTEYQLRFKAVRDMSALRESQTLTDITLVAEGIEFHAHKLILFTASPYFEGLFTSNFKEKDQTSIALSGVSAKTLQLYLDLIYGKEIALKNWKQAFDLFDYFNSTLLSWSKDSAVISFWIRPDEYVRYIQRLEEIYEGEIPVEVVNTTRKYLTPEVDLTDLGEEFIDIVRSSSFSRADYQTTPVHFSSKAR